MTGYARTRLLGVATAGFVVAIALQWAAAETLVSVLFHPSGPQVRLALLTPVLAALSLVPSLADTLREQEALFGARMRLLRLGHAGWVCGLLAVHAAVLTWGPGVSDLAPEIMRNAWLLIGGLMACASWLAWDLAWVPVVVVVMLHYATGLDPAFEQPRGWAVLLAPASAGSTICAVGLGLVGLALFVARGPARGSTSDR